MCLKASAAVHTSLKCDQAHCAIQPRRRLDGAGAIDVVRRGARRTRCAYVGGVPPRILGWTVEREDADWVQALHAPTGVGLSFQTEEAYVRPTWPAGPGDQQMMIHLDINVDREAAGAPCARGGRDAGGPPAARRRSGVSRPRRTPILFVGVTMLGPPTD